MQDPEFAHYVERNIESFHLVNKTGAKRIIIWLPWQRLIAASGKI